MTKHDWDATFFSFQEFKFLFWILNPEFFGWSLEVKLFELEQSLIRIKQAWNLQHERIFSTPGSLGQTTTPWSRAEIGLYNRY